VSWIEFITEIHTFDPCISCRGFGGLGPDLPRPQIPKGAWNPRQAIHEGWEPIHPEDQTGDRRRGTMLDEQGLSGVLLFTTRRAVVEEALKKKKPTSRQRWPAWRAIQQGGGFRGRDWG